MKKSKKTKVIISLIAVSLCFAQPTVAGFDLLSFFRTKKVDRHYENCQFHITGLYMPYTVNSMEYVPVSKINIMHDVDVDGDGVPNRFDNCPVTFGTLAMNGCPPIDNSKAISYGNSTVNLKEDDFDLMVTVFSSLEFEGEQQSLTKESQNHLNKLVKFLKKEKKLYLYISAYVNVGSNRMQNYYLSESRALSVSKYLIKKGIKRDRIETLFFGDMMPVVGLPPTRFEVEICDKKK
jgi:flagellar motor protein MotB